MDNWSDSDAGMMYLVLAVTFVLAVLLAIGACGGPAVL